MTARNGYLATGGAGQALPSGTRGNARRGTLAAFAANASIAVVSYKNEGWYAAGSTWETWITADAPATSPPSGHTLTFLQHVVVAQ